MTVQVPTTFAEHIRRELGQAGAEWIDALPATAARLADRWSLTLGEPFGLSFNYVCRARLADGTDSVFKIGPWGRENVQEISALRIYGGQGACRLLAADESLGACLLERIQPGRMLREIAAHDDDEATRIAARLMRRLWRPTPEVKDRSGLRDLSAWFARAFPLHRRTYGGAGPFPERVLSYGERLASDLLASAQGSVVLHADFHHENVLSAEREPWLVIDPKGMLGDPGYEVGPLLLNPDPEIGQPKPASLLARRLDILADELTYDRERLRCWGIAHAVLSACWSAEGGGDGWQTAIAAAETLMDL